MALNLWYALVALIALRHMLLDARGDELKVYQQPVDHVATYDISISNTRVRVGARSNRHLHAHHESTCLDSLEVCEGVLVCTERHRRPRKWQT